ncbi:hypothetical protein KKF34_06155 [Myxococcota bacterium]|nr:hypothetical protein [Myxococcota bacterium]MBU1383209.1 hypothetical protein [Myxococcota bacterium]MBU1496443.1 hypothetical protein [Myxococcota bacterium]
MSPILAICLENLNATSESERYLKCTALTGRKNALVIDADGLVHWKSDKKDGFELWVSADERLILYLPEGVEMEVQVSRSGRSVMVPNAKPVVLIDGDEISMTQFRIRVHVHGFVEDEYSPSWYTEPQVSSGSRVVRAAATAALAFTAMVGISCSTNDGKTEKPKIEVRDRPPDVAPANPPMNVEKKPDPTPPVEIRDKPPEAPAIRDEAVKPGKKPEKKPEEMKPAEMKPMPPPMIEIRDKPPSPPAKGDGI